MLEPDLEALARNVAHTQIEYEQAEFRAKKASDSYIEALAAYHRTTGSISHIRLSRAYDEAIAAQVEADDKANPPKKR